MAGYEVSVGTELLPGLLNGPDGLARLVETVLNQVLEAQVTETLGATRHERTDGRAGYRNGYRARTLRSGSVRSDSFSLELIK
jgi:transposase-like protein